MTDDNASFNPGCDHISSEHTNSDDDFDFLFEENYPCAQSQCASKDWATIVLSCLFFVWVLVGMS